MNNEAHVFMNKFCVLSKNSESYFIKRLSEEVGKDEFTVFNPFGESDLPKGTFYLVRTTGVYHSRRDLELLKKVSQKNIFNPLSTLEIFRSKISQFKWFEEKKISIPPYLNLMGAKTQEVKEFFERHREVVLKPHFGQGGWGVRLVNQEEVLKVLDSEDSAYLLQPYIKGEEIRYFFIKGRLPLIQRRIPTKGVAANFQSEGVSEIISLSSKIQEKIEDVIALSGALYGAIDCFKVGDEILFLELNTVPGVEQAEKVSKRNLVREILSLFNK